MGISPSRIDSLILFLLENYIYIYIYIYICYPPPDVPTLFGLKS